MGAKDKVLDAALPLFIDHGYHGTSIKLIVEKSGVSTGSVYHHFSNKEDIIKELYAQRKKHMNNFILKNVEVTGSIRKALRDYWFSRIKYSYEYKNNAKFIRTFFNGPLVQSEYLISINAMYDNLQNLIKKSMEDEEIIKMDTVFFFYDLFNACDAVNLYFETENMELDKDFMEFTFKKYWRSIVNMAI
ncbi:MAG: TetR/AcrR family transcriptional regulator [Firmicutes bacterium]|jgi:AcrR family transcriptional regulator|nr:TetR/AcrR family transcriptional regulator [Bacillota bacterium]